MKMLRPFLGIALLLFSGMMETGFAQQRTDIRKVRWGFTPKQVKEAETARPSSVKREMLVYSRIPLDDRTVGLEYEFNGDSLLSASYYYYVTASITKDDVMAASVDFESLLNEKYGPGRSSMLGDTRNVVWLTPRTQINLSIGNVDKGWSLEVRYLCRFCGPDQAKNGVSSTAEFKPLKDVPDF